MQVHVCQAGLHPPESAIHRVFQQLRSGESSRYSPFYFRWHQLGVFQLGVEFTFAQETTRFADYERSNMVISSEIGDVLVPVPIYRQLEGE